MQVLSHKRKYMVCKNQVSKLQSAALMVELKILSTRFMQQPSQYFHAYYKYISGYRVPLS